VFSCYTVFAIGVDRSAIGTRHPHLAVILSEAKDLLLYVGIGPFPAEKQIPRYARNDNALWFTPIVKML